MPVPPPPISRPYQPIMYDRVKEVTSTSGTGTVTLMGSPSGYQDFSVVGDGNWCHYTIADQSGADWEVGIGQYTLPGTTLSRDVVLDSSNSGALVSFGSNLKDVFICIPATLANRSLYANTDVVTVANTTTQTSLFASSLVGLATLPANYLYPGKSVRLTARGYVSTAGSAPTLQLRLKLGGSTVADTGAITPPASLSSVYWELEAEIACYLSGASGSIWAQGRLMCAPTTLSPTVAGMVNSSAGTVDTTTAEAIDLTVTWGTASASNTITATHLTLESIN